MSEETTDIKKDTLECPKCKKNVELKPVNMTFGVRGNDVQILTGKVGLFYCSTCEMAGLVDNPTKAIILL